MKEATRFASKPRPAWLAGETQPAVFQYTAAVVAFLLAWAVRAALDPWLGNIQAFAFFYVAITFIAWWAGWRPALLTLVLSYVTAHWFFLPPRHAFAIEDVRDAVEHFAYFFISLTIVALMELMRRARLRAADAAATAEQALRDLQEDVRKREEAEQALGRSEERFRAIFENAGLGIAEADSQSRFLEANERCCQILGRPRRELVGLSVHEVTYPEDQGASDQLNQDLVAGRIPRFNYEKRYLRGDGTPVWVRLTVSAIRGPGGEHLRGIAVIEDITERKRSEEALQEAQAKLAQTNERLEQTVQERTASLRNAVQELQHFSYSIAHDMRAPLRAMQSYACLLTDEWCVNCAQPQNLEFLRRIREAAARLDKLVTDSLDYSKILREKIPLHAVDLARLLRGLIETYPNLQPHERRIHLAAALPPVCGNEAALTQCFANLLSNAVKFVPPGTQPDVSVWAETRRGRVRVWVEDKGIGMPKEFLSRAFDMFQRGVTGYDGTGIGLAIVRKAAERMGGRAGVESELGKGSRFWVDLRPAAVSELQARAE